MLSSVNTDGISEPRNLGVKLRLLTSNFKLQVSPTSHAAVSGQWRAQAPTSSSGGGFGDSHELVCHRRLALFTTLFWVVIVAGLAAAAAASAASAARVGHVFVLVVWMMAAFDGDSEMMLLVVSLFCYRTSFYVAVMTNSELPVGNASKLHDCCLLSEPTTPPHQLQKPEVHVTKVPCMPPDHETLNLQP